MRFARRISPRPPLPQVLEPQQHSRYPFELTAERGDAEMSAPAVFDLCEPRADVRAGTASNSDFAADLSLVIEEPVARAYVGEITSNNRPG